MLLPPLARSMTQLSPGSPVAGGCTTSSTSLFLTLGVAIPASVPFSTLPPGALPQLPLMPACQRAMCLRVGTFVTSKLSTLRGTRRTIFSSPSLCISSLCSLRSPRAGTGGVWVVPP